MRLDEKRNKGILVLILIVSTVCYYLIAYNITRTLFPVFITLITVLFVLYLLVTSVDLAKQYYKQLLLFSLFIRLVFLFAIPTLSDDYFRFIWDGVLTTNGINSSLYKPIDIVQINGNELSSFLIGLKANMNSVNFYSPYPPVLQFIFYVVVKLSGYHLTTNIITLRLLVIIAEVATVWIGIKMLDQFKIDRHKILLYTLNPLVIIELTGNLHGEAFLIFFLLSSLYLLIKRYFFASALFLGLAVSTKLLPLIFIPVIVSFIGIKKGLVYCFIVLLIVTISFIPFFNVQLIVHFAESIGYYFQKFEFNGSLYYLLRWIGYSIAGFNLIYFIGKVLPVLSFVIIMIIAFYKKPISNEVFFERLLISLLVYYLCSLTVHPWYITLLVILSIFTVSRFAMVWSALIMLSYSAYTQYPYHEILWVTAVEYLCLSVVLYKEFVRPSAKKINIA